MPRRSPPLRRSTAVTRARGGSSSSHGSTRRDLINKVAGAAAASVVWPRRPARADSRATGGGTDDRLAFVFSGGGAKGAFGVGVFTKILEKYEGLSWQIVSGTSTGALIAPFAALAKGEPTYARKLTDLYLGATLRKIFKSNISGSRIITSILRLPEGIYDWKPLEQLIRASLLPADLRKLAASDVTALVTAVNLQTGALALCTQDSYGPRVQRWFDEHAGKPSSVDLQLERFEKFPRMMLASAAMPVAISPVTLGGHQLVDGGVVDIAPLRAAVAAGATDALVIMMSPLKSTAPQGHLKNLLTVGLRSLALLEDEIIRNDVRTLSAISRIRLAAPAQFDSALERLRNLPGEAGIIEQYGTTPNTPDPVVIAPEYSLAGVLDFESRVPVGWPEKPSGKPVVPIMKARFDYGQRHAEKLMKAGGSLVAVLDRFKKKN